MHSRNWKQLPITDASILYFSIIINTLTRHDNDKLCPFKLYTAYTGPKDHLR